MKPYAFPNLDLPLVDPQTGRINKGWYQLLSSMYLLLGGSDPVSTPDLAVQAGQMDENFSATIELENSVEAFRNGQSMDDALLAQFAEVAKVLNDALANLTTAAESSARIAELEKRLADMELSAAFGQPVQTVNALTGATTTAPPAGSNVTSTPAAPNGYLTLNIDGAPRQIPYY